MSKYITDCDQEKLSNKYTFKIGDKVVPHGSDSMCSLEESSHWAYFGGVRQGFLYVTGYIEFTTNEDLFYEYIVCGTKDVRGNCSISGDYYTPDKLTPYVNHGKK